MALVRALAAAPGFCLSKGWWTGEWNEEQPPLTAAAVVVVCKRCLDALSSYLLYVQVEGTGAVLSLWKPLYRGFAAFQVDAVLFRDLSYWNQPFFFFFYTNAKKHASGNWIFRWFAFHYTGTENWGVFFSLLTRRFHLNSFKGQTISYFYLHCLN